MEPEAPRILVLYASQRLTGPGRGLLQLVSESKRKGSFTLCSFGRPGAPSSDFHSAAVERGIDARIIHQRSAFDPLMLRHTMLIAREARVDVVQSHGYKTHLLAAAVSVALGIPWLAVAHGWTDENARIRLYNRLDRRLLARADTVVAVSPVLEESISDIRRGRRTVTILNAIERSRFGDADGQNVDGTVRRELGIDPDVPLLTVIGRLSPEKGQDLFLEAFAALRSRDPRPIAVLVGEGPEREALDRLAADLGVAPWVRFAGFQREVGRFFRAADVVVLPSRSEGLPNAILEAHLLERPVVAFDVGGVRELIRDRDTGWLVAAGDVDGLVCAMDDAINNPDGRDEMVANASRDLFPKFGVESRVQAFEHEYDRLWTRSSPRL